MISFGNAASRNTTKLVVSNSTDSTWKWFKNPCEHEAIVLFGDRGLILAQIILLEKTVFKRIPICSLSCFPSNGNLFQYTFLLILFNNNSNGYSCVSLCINDFVSLQHFIDSKLNTKHYPVIWQSLYRRIHSTGSFFTNKISLWSSRKIIPSVTNGWSLKYETFISYLFGCDFELR